MVPAEHNIGGRWEKGRMTMIRCRWKYGDLRGKHGGGSNAKRGEGRKQKGERKEALDVERGSAAARLIAVDLHDKRSRQLVTKVALRH